LTRREIAQAVYSVCPGLSRGQAKGFVDAVIEEIISALAVGEDVSIHVSASSRFARSRAPGRNPKTGISAPISARKWSLQSVRTSESRADGE